MIDARESVVDGRIEITVAFDQTDWDFFGLDKGDPKEWIRNACSANNAHREKLIKRELAEKTIVTDADVQAHIAKLKADKIK